MSVVVRGMEMPENCDECPFGEWEDADYYSCCLMDFSYKHNPHTGRLEDCPLFELKDWREA